MKIGIYLLAAFAVTCYAALSPIAKKLMHGIPPLALISISMVFLILYAVVASFIYEKDFSITKLTLNAWGGIAIYSLINFIGFATYLYALQRMPVTHYQLLMLMTPIIGGIIAYFLLNEPFKPQYLAGLVLIGAGLFVAIRDWG